MTVACEHLKFNTESANKKHSDEDDVNESKKYKKKLANEICICSRHGFDKKYEIVKRKKLHMTYGPSSGACYVRDRWIIQEATTWSFTAALLSHTVPLITNL